MEVAEIVVYMGAAILIGGFLLTLLTGWDTKDTYSEVQDIITKEVKDQLKSDDLALEIHDFWQDCGFGEIPQRKAVYIEGKGEITKEMIFKDLKKINYCSLLQSEEYGCGQREDLEMPDVELPMLVSLTCDNSSVTVGV